MKAKILGLFNQSKLQDSIANIWSKVNAECYSYSRQKGRCWLDCAETLSTSFLIPKIVHLVLYGSSLLYNVTDVYIYTFVDTTQTRAALHWSRCASGMIYQAEMQLHIRKAADSSIIFACYCRGRDRTQAVRT